MTSYGGATRELGSPARARWYRRPGRARTSAIGLVAELDVAQVGHPRHVAQLGQHVSRDAVVDGQDHHRVATGRIAANLHAGDVDVVLAEDRAHASHDAWAIVVPADQEATFWNQVDAKGIDAHGARLTHQDGAGQLVAAHADGDQARVAAVRRAPPLDQLHAAARRDEARVDGVDAIFGERLQHSFDGGRDEEVDVVLGELALEVELDRADPAGEELRVQSRQALGEVGEGPEVGKLFRGHRGGVDREPRKITCEHRGHLFGHIKRDRDLRFDRRSSYVRSRDEVGQRQQRVIAGRLGHEHVRGGGREASGFQGVKKRSFVDDTAASGVDQASTGLHQRQLRGAEQVPVGVDQRHMYGDKVRALEQLVQAHELDVEQLRPLDRDDRVVGDDLHLEPMRALGDLGADVAKPDHPEGLAADLGADELRASPLSALDRRVGLRHPAREREEQRNSVLGGGDDVAARRVDHQNALERGRGNIDVVHPNARPPDYAELSPGFENKGGDTRLAPDHQCVEVRNPLDQLRLQQLADHGHLSRPAQPFQPVLGQRVGDQNPGHYRAAAATPWNEDVSAATARPSAGATSSSSNACSMAQSTWTTSPSATAPRCPTRIILPAILAWPPAITTPYLVSSSLRKAATSRPGGGTAEVTVFERYPSRAYSWKANAPRPARVARGSRGCRAYTLA